MTACHVNPPSPRYFQELPSVVAFSVCPLSHFCDLHQRAQTWLMLGQAGVARAEIPKQLWALQFRSSHIAALLQAGPWAFGVHCKVFVFTLGRPLGTPVLPARRCPTEVDYALGVHLSWLHQPHRLRSKLATCLGRQVSHCPI